MGQITEEYHGPPDPSVGIFSAKNPSRGAFESMAAGQYHFALWTIRPFGAAQVVWQNLGWDLDRDATDAPPAGIAR